MIAVDINPKQLRELRKATAKAGKAFPRELAAAVNAVAKKTRINIGREILHVVNIKKAIAEKQIRITGIATPQKPSGQVSLGKSKREGLQHFGGRQDKKGVSYKISKKGGRKRVQGAFMGPRPGELAPRLNGGVFKRVGKSRLPIVKLYGVSPWGAFKGNNLEKVEKAFISKELSKQMERRINLNILRANGLVKR